MNQFQNHITTQKVYPFSLFDKRRRERAGERVKERAKDSQFQRLMRRVRE